MQNLLLGMREAVTIWIGLVGIATLAFAFLSALARAGASGRVDSGRVDPERLDPERPRRARMAKADGASGAARRTRVTRRTHAAHRTRAPRRDGLAAQAQDQRRYAEEVAVAAGRATVTAQRRRVEWLAAQRAQEAAWRAFEAADNAARRVLRADALPLPSTPQTPQGPETPADIDELVSRERHLHRAAHAAYQRGELSVAQLLDVMCHRNGWDPHRHPVEQERTLRLIARERRLRAYHQASEMERTAWQAAELAAAAKRSLDAEAFAAAIGAHRTQHRVGKARAWRVPAEITTVLPSLATW